MSLPKPYTPFSVDELSNIIQKDAKSLCLFSCYREHGSAVEINTQIYVKDLSKEFDQVIFLTNDDKPILPKDAAQINATIVPIPNHLWDIGMCFRVLGNLDIASGKYDRIALVNDSCIVLKPLTNIFKYAKDHSFGFWGISDSYEIAHHLQTYFVVFEGNPKTKVMETLASFVKQVMDDLVGMQNVKQNVIQKVEIGMSQYFIDHEIQLDAIYKYSDVTKNKTSISEQPVCPNPTYCFWDRMLEKGCPIIKKSRMHFANERMFIEKFTEFDSSNFKKNKIL